MKKILALIMVVAMVATSAVMIFPSAAADTAETANEVTYSVPDIDRNFKIDANGVRKVSVGEKATLSWAGLSDMGIQTKGESEQLALGPNADAKETYVKFTFDVTKAGEYELTLEYAAKTSDEGPRVADIIINDGEQTSLDIATNDDWSKTMTLTVKAELKKGTNTVVITNPAPVEGVTHKYINVSSLTVKGEGVITVRHAEAVTPIAAYDFRDSKLDDTTGKQSSIVIANNEGMSDEENRNASSCGAAATIDGIDLWNGFFRLPDDLFADVDEKDITGLTISMTITKNSDWGLGRHLV